MIGLVTRQQETGDLSRVEADFAVQIATDVWLGTLTDEAARAVLGAYAMACHRDRRAQARFRATLVREYRRCRERQDVCS